MLRRAVALAVVAVVSWGGPAFGDDVTTARLRELAERAPEDPDALEELRRVESVDGRPVEMERLLSGATGAEAAQRVAHLTSASGDAEPALDPEAARSDARDILSSRRFRPAAVPRPFRGILQRVGSWLRPIGEWIADRFGAIGRWFERAAPSVPGGQATLWVLTGIAVAAVTFAIATRALARRGALASTSSLRHRRSRLDAGALERAAAEAQRDGDHERALRLLFRAGLIRAHDADILRFDDSLTTRQIGRALRSPEFDAIGARFDAVVYGRRTAGPDDAEAVRAGWRRVLEGAA